MKKLTLLLLALTLVLTACGGGKGDSENTIVIGGKKFTEQIILVNLMSQLLEEKTELDVVEKADLGPTDVLQQAMEDGDIDIYAEYTGTAYMIVLKEELDTTDPEVIYDRVKKGYEEKYDITWLDPFQFNNTYAIAMREEQAAELGIEKVSDLQAHASDLILGSDFDFLEREDGITNFNEVYGLEWKDNKGMDPGLMYSAVRDGNLDAITAYATDGRIPRFDLRILEDDKGFFPPYYAAPIMPKEVLEKHPEIADVLNELAPHLTMEKMAELNSKVDIDGERTSTVARDFLIETGLISE
ncbi:glycine betaine ABC transporter substrate-binding protein [Paenisporosarcina sp. TG20]|uniref:glycine betaine ABC transporter substrate-binding protein n=1 Tax=Paenisporosarcina sp. TG20 TaxID=1211706 RepID=UPI0002F8D822|nr:glycine betaine ABC transporter substrate-binding protein [Paenisporosarcina sp. TG20]